MELVVPLYLSQVYWFKPVLLGELFYVVVIVLFFFGFCVAGVLCRLCFWWSISFHIEYAIKPPIYDPSSCRSQRYSDRVVDGIAAVFLALKRRPVIRYQRTSDTAKRIAHETAVSFKLWDKSIFFPLMSHMLLACDWTYYLQLAFSLVYLVFIWKILLCSRNWCISTKPVFSILDGLKAPRCCLSSTEEMTQLPHCSISGLIRLTWIKVLLPDVLLFRKNKSFSLARFFSRQWCMNS